MLQEDKIWLAKTTDGKNIYLLPQMANRHGVLVGMNNLEVTLGAQMLAEGFSDLGVPVFMLDDSNRLSGMLKPDESFLKLHKSNAFFNLEESGFSYQGYPVTFWDIFAKRGIPFRTHIDNMDSHILSHILALNDSQTKLLQSLLSIAKNENLIIEDVKDLKAILNYFQNYKENYAYEIGHIDNLSIENIFRTVASFEIRGIDQLFYEPILDFSDLLRVNNLGKGIINILDSETLVFDANLYSGLLIWLLCKMDEHISDIYTQEKLRMVFIIDEAQLIFKNLSSALLERIERVIQKLGRKGVGLYFCTQNMNDIPDPILKHLDNKIHFAPQAYTPTAQKVIRKAVRYFRKNPSFDTFKTLVNLSSGEILVSLLGANGAPSKVEKAYILPPQSYSGSICDTEREQYIWKDILNTKYSHTNHA